MSILSVHERRDNESYYKLLSDNLVFTGHLSSNLVNALRPVQTQSRKFHEFPSLLSSPLRFFLEKPN